MVGKDPFQVRIPESKVMSQGKHLLPKDEFEFGDNLASSGLRGCDSSQVIAWTVAMLNAWQAEDKSSLPRPSRAFLITTSQMCSGAKSAADTWAVQAYRAIARGSSSVTVPVATSYVPILAGDKAVLTAVMVSFVFDIFKGKFTMRTRATGIRGPKASTRGRTQISSKEPTGRWALLIFRRFIWR